MSWELGLAVGWGRRKGAVDPRLLPHAGEFGHGHLCSGLSVAVMSGVRVDGVKRRGNKITNAGLSAAALEGSPVGLIAGGKAGVCTALWEYPELQ